MKPFTFHRSLLTVFLFTIHFSLFTFSSTFTDKILDTETIIYHTFDGTKSLVTTEHISTVVVNNEKVHKIKLEGSDGGSATIYLKYNSLYPESVSYYGADGKPIKQLVYLSDQIQVKLNNGQEQYSFPDNRKDYYDMNSFFHLMRGYPINEREITFWSFLPEIRRGFLLYAKNLGEDSVQINKKNYSCYKIEVGAAGLVESTLFSQKFYFWITKSEPRQFIQFEGKDFMGNQQRTVVISQ